MYLKVVSLSQGCIAVVDDEDYELVADRNWHAVKMGRNMYAQCMVKGADGRTTTMMMQQVVMPAPTGYVVDHIDGDTLDNRKEKLRICTYAENARNRQKHLLENPTSRYKGITWKKSIKMWRAQIRVSGKNGAVGHWNTEEAAALSYNLAVARHFGDYARPNKIELPTNLILEREFVASGRTRQAKQRILTYIGQYLPQGAYDLNELVPGGELPLELHMELSKGS